MARLADEATTVRVPCALVADLRITTQGDGGKVGVRLELGNVRLELEDGTSVRLEGAEGGGALRRALDSRE